MRKFVADLHLHSSYSRATSRSLNFETLSAWAKMKGIELLASTDFTHPVWWKETRDKLKESKHSGFYEFNNTYFVLGTEISCIYSQGGRLRRIHCLVFFPKMEDVEKFNQNLARVGNLAADGRPILGMSAKELLARALQANEKAIFIPAHVWTPWFSLYGSNSGFDSMKECFGDLSKYIYAVETGLSSDPAMNWRIEELDNRSIVSFSDAHSCPKIGREATVFDTDFSYEGLLKALKTTWELAAPSVARQTRLPDKRGSSRPLASSAENPENIWGTGLPQTGDETTESRRLASNKLVDKSKPSSASPKIAFTIEFFPEEGKYHFTGHRNCGIKQSPNETAKEGIICPTCKKKLTIGVMHRVEQLAHKDRPDGFRPKDRPPFKNLVPLLEILAESLGSPVTSERVVQEYRRLVGLFGSEIEVLINTPIEDLEKQSLPRVAEGVKKVREGNIVVESGFDGVYGVVKIWPAPSSTIQREAQSSKPEKSIKQASGQVGLFD